MDIEEAKDLNNLFDRRISNEDQAFCFDDVVWANESIGFLLKEIEKLQKENEELRRKNKELWESLQCRPRQLKKIGGKKEKQLDSKVYVVIEIFPNNVNRFITAFGKFSLAMNLIERLNYIPDRKFAWLDWNIKEEDFEENPDLLVRILWQQGTEYYNKTLSGKSKKIS